MVPRLRPRGPGDRPSHMVSGLELCADAYDATIRLPDAA